MQTFCAETTDSGNNNLDINPYRKNGVLGG